MYGEYEAVIGLEIHAQMFTLAKCFSSASTNFGLGNNENVTEVCAGMPGTLPVLNKKAVELSVKTGLALNCDIQIYSVFDRKQYFYPDMPKGYQITQLEKPIALGGYVDFFLDGEKKRVHLERAHMEEDAGKSTHHGEYTLINLNRAGTPLLEIVSAPEMTTPKEAAAYAKAVRQILRYTEVCDGNLEEGSMRCDCNVSVRRKGEKELGTKVELKNINSFRFIEKAVEYEIHRQIDCIQSGEEIFQETRLYDSAKNKTFSMRKKEAANDYRYFPDPDLLPLILEQPWVDEIKKNLPEMPMEKQERFISDYSLSVSESDLLTGEKEFSDFYEDVVKICKNPKLAANWMMGEFLRLFNESKVEINQLPIGPEQLGKLIQMIDKKELSGKMAKEVFEKLWETGRDPQDLVKEMGMSQITDEDAILKIVRGVLDNNLKSVAEYKAGKEKLYGFFVGQVMKQTKGQANPEAVNKILKKELSK